MTSVLVVVVRAPSERARVGVVEKEAREEADSYVTHSAF